MPAITDTEVTIGFVGLLKYNEKYREWVQKIVNSKIPFSEKHAKLTNLGSTIYDKMVDDDVDTFVEFALDVLEDMVNMKEFADICLEREKLRLANKGLL